MSIEQEDRDGMLRILDPAGVEDRQSGRPFAGMILHEKQAKAIADALIAAGFSRRPMSGVAHDAQVVAMYDQPESDLDRDAIKARAERVARMLVRAGGGDADLLNLVLDDTPALLAALEEAEIRLGVVEYQRNLYRGQIIELTGRAESAERRIAAVEAAWYSATELGDSGVLYTDVGEAAMDAIWAALHPVAPIHDKQGDER